MNHRMYVTRVEKFVKDFNKCKKKKRIVKAIAKKHKYKDYWNPYLRLYWELSFSLKRARNPIYVDSVIQLHSREINFLKSNKLVYFFDHIDTLNNLLKAKYSIDNIFLHEECFVVALPSVCSVNKNGSGILVSIEKNSSQKIRYLQYTENILDKEKTMITVPDETYDNDNLSICMHYINEDEQISFLNHDLATLARTLKCKNWKDFKEMEKNAAARLNSHGEKDIIADNFFKQQFEIIKLVAAFLVYKQACPERIKDGLPSEHRKIVTTLTNAAKTQCIHGVKNHHDSPVGHYRSWHFRQLTHEKYYQGEHKNKPIGSRIVFVHDSIVNDKIDAKTTT